MFLDLREMESGTSLQAETCVIGSGAAGITLARELAAAGRDVLLLEAGGLDLEADTQALHEGQMTGEQWGPKDTPLPVSTTRLRYFGGTTNHWAGYCRPLRPVDLEVRPGLSRSGWPIAYDELARWYPRATEVLSLASDDFTPEHWNDAVGHGDPLLHDDDVATVVFQLSGVSFNTRYREELERSDRIQVVLHANVTELRSGASGRHVEEVRATTLEGITATVTADVVVLAAGGIETPRLLLAANGLRGIGNDHDLVGRFFCEHFQHTLGFAVLTPSPADLSGYERTEHVIDDRTITVQSALIVADEVLHREGLLGMEAQLLPRPFGGEDVPSTGAGVSIQDAGALLPPTAGDAPRSVALIQVNAEQELNPSSRIRLGSSLDAIGVPTTDVHWAHTPLDRSSILAGLRLIGRALGRRGLGRLLIAPGNITPTGEGTGFLSRLEVDPDAADLEGFHLAHGNHHMCTTRMSSDPASGVVDPDCRVHGTDNLYVAGSAAFATPGVASPTITLVALTIRLADHLHRSVLP